MGAIKMIPVISSNVASMGYDEETRKLLVKFLSGVMYEYSDVPPEKWEGLKGTSVGSYLHREIIGHYACEKIVEKVSEEKAI